MVNQRRRQNKKKDYWVLTGDQNMNAWAGIFKQSMGARNRVGIGMSYRAGPPGYTQPGGIGSLESILGLLKSL
jgi:hypothetical protein